MGANSLIFECENTTEKFGMAHCSITLSKNRLTCASPEWRPLIVCFDTKAKGVVHCEFLPKGQTVSGAFYPKLWRRLTRRVNRVRPLIDGNQKMHHVHALRHTYSKIQGLSKLDDKWHYNNSPNPKTVSISTIFNRIFSSVPQKVAKYIKYAWTHTLKDLLVSSYQGDFEL